MSSDRAIRGCSIILRVSQAQAVRILSGARANYPPGLKIRFESLKHVALSGSYNLQDRPIIDTCKF